MIHRPTEPELLAAMKSRLRARIAQQGIHTLPLPERRPSMVADPERRARSLRTSHLPRELPALIPWRDTGRYMPELSAAIDDDPNLSDGARRCARKLAEYIHRCNRDGRCAEITVSYLVRGLRRCRRTVQRYLRQLEHAGYIRVDVIAARTRMCVGLAVQMLKPFFPKHRKQPTRSMNSGATPLSHKHSSRYKTRLISRALWAWSCCEGVHRAYMKTLTPLPSPS